MFYAQSRGETERMPKQKKTANIIYKGDNHGKHSQLLQPCSVIKAQMPRRAVRASEVGSRSWPRHSSCPNLAPQHDESALFKCHTQSNTQTTQISVLTYILGRPPFLPQYSSKTLTSKSCLKLVKFRFSDAPSTNTR